MTKTLDKHYSFQLVTYNPSALGSEAEICTSSATLGTSLYSWNILFRYPPERAQNDPKKESERIQGCIQHKSVSDQLSVADQTRRRMVPHRHLLPNPRLFRHKLIAFAESSYINQEFHHTIIKIFVIRRISWTNFSLHWSLLKTHPRVFHPKWLIQTRPRRLFFWAFLIVTILVLCLFSSTSWRRNKLDQYWNLSCLSNTVICRSPLQRKHGAQGLLVALKYSFLLA